MCGLPHVEEITIHIVFENESGWVKPVIENLTAHHVSSNTPAVLVALMAKPVVAEHLGIEIVCLEGGVMDVHLGTFKEEEAMVIHQLVSAVEPEEDGLVDTLIVMDKLGMC